ncbi:hypothetical protein CHX27_05300 [Flavobacterium aurantiibacter]|uniref:Uncharacterized protein n=1 Tax=Flavobacterium aurantiibacter TaxID=2023067 RepID=A0A255ZYW2_9FLAO|nr:hypothetical protein CHX27_05300 [Flavobacterium aurantiibacter]
MYQRVKVKFFANAHTFIGRKSLNGSFLAPIGRKARLLSGDFLRLYGGDQRKPTGKPLKNGGEKADLEGKREELQENKIKPQPFYRMGFI